jgi:hypothetical protein
MSEQSSEQSLAARIATELNKCRLRGLDDIDAEMKGQPPVEAPELERLARSYGEAKRPDAFGRAAQIRVLIRDGLAAYAEAGNEAESRFVSSLFFDPPGTEGRRTPSDRLKDAAKAVGLQDDERRLRDYRRSMLVHFAEFLVALVERASADTTEQEPITGEGPVPRPRMRSPLVWVGAGVTGLVVIAAVVVSVVLTGNHPGSDHTATEHGSGSTSSCSGSIGLPPGHTTYTEQAGEFGSLTVTDPCNPSTTGVKVQPYQKVQVSCRVYSVPPGWNSVYPDGFWYLLAGPPWGNHYYAIAKNFLNGDKIGGPTLHNTDLKVPMCPG